MSSKNDYGEKLQSPLWQKKRLEILSRDNWCCTNCGNNKEQLHVHHEIYFGNPWDAPNDKLKTLCRKCHTRHHSDKYTIEEMIYVKEGLEAKIKSNKPCYKTGVWNQALSVVNREIINYYETQKPLQR